MRSDPFGERALKRVWRRRRVVCRRSASAPSGKVLREAAPAGGYGIWLSTREAARRRAVSPSVVWRAVARGELVPVRIPGWRGYRFEAQSVEAWRPPCDRPREPRQPDEALLAQIRWAAKRLGRPPTQRDLVRLGGMPSATTLRRRFGSYPTALRRAGLTPVAPVPRRRGRPRTCGELAALLRALAAELGQRPTCADVLRAEGIPPPSTFVRRFGSWRRALRVALATPDQGVDRSTRGAELDAQDYREVLDQHFDDWYFTTHDEGDHSDADAVAFRDERLDRDDLAGMRERLDELELEHGQGLEREPELERG